MCEGDFSEDVKRDAVEHITEWYYLVGEVENRSGVSLHSFYGQTENFERAAWAARHDRAAEIPNLKRELIPAAEERDILKNHPAFRQGCKVGYEFAAEDPIKRLFLVLSTTAVY